MRTLVRSFGIAVCVAALAGAPASAQNPPAAPAARPAAPSAGTPTPIVGVVDVALIQEQASAMKSIKEQMQKEDLTFKSEVEKREKDLRTADQELQQQRTLLSADAFGERRRTFEAQVTESQRYMAARKRQLDTGFSEGMRTVEVQLNTVLREIATERGLNLIIARQSVLLAEKVLDITDEVKQRLDKRLPRVAIKLPPLQK
ncbi:MAG: OmpH family outer membrane protein [Proteobacteria bacterium]|nr:OmpH family outer membrane protein [Pseudomonadota bacterium]